MSTLGISNVIVFTGILLLVYCLLRFIRELSSKRGPTSNITCLPDHSETMCNTSTLSEIPEGILSFALHALASSSVFPGRLSVPRALLAQTINPKPKDKFETLQGNSAERILRDLSRSHVLAKEIQELNFEGERPCGTS